MRPLDPHSSNQLGKGIIDSDVEARFIASGIVWARQLHKPGEFPPAYACIETSYAEESERIIRGAIEACERTRPIPALVRLPQSQEA